MSDSTKPATQDLDAIRSRIESEFNRSGMLLQINARLGDVAPGRVHIHLPYGSSVTQHLGYFHAGASSTIADAAGGFACMTLVPEDRTVLSVEFKINFMAPAQGESLEAVAQVVRSGRTLMVVQADVYALKAGVKKAVALMQQTIISIPRQGR